MGKKNDIVINVGIDENNIRSSIVNSISDASKEMFKGSAAISRDKLITNISDYMKKNSAMAKQFKDELNGIILSLKSLGAEADVTSFADQFYKLRQSIHATGQEGKKTLDVIKEKAWYGLASQIGMYFGFNDIIEYIKRGINTVKELDTAMIEIKKVSDETEASYKNFSQTVAASAKEIASTNKELLNSSADYLSLGYNIEQAEELAKNTALFVNIGDGIDINTATEDIITAMRAFDIQAEDSIKIVDSYNQIGNTYAVSASGIGEAMKRSASALETANNTFEESIGLITAMDEIVQNDENTGTALKILSLRLRGASEELKSMGEDTDGLCKSASELREKLVALTGVDIMLDAHTFKSTAQQIQEIGSVWERLDDASQAATLEIIAGKSRSNAVAALLKNYKQIEAVINNLKNAEGAALKENEAIINSIEGRINILSAAGEEFWQTFINTDAVKDGISLLTKLFEAATKVADTFGTLGTVATIGGGMLGARGLGLT